MQIVRVKTDEGIRPPTQNPFKVYANAVAQRVSCDYFVDTGLRLTLPPNTTLSLRPVCDVFIMAFSLVDDQVNSSENDALDEGQLHLIAHGKVVEGEQIATAWIVQQNISQVRFMERNNSGSRIIRGGAVDAKCRTED